MSFILCVMLSKHIKQSHVLAKSLFSTLIRPTNSLQYAKITDINLLKAILSSKLPCNHGIRTQLHFSSKSESTSKPRRTCWKCAEAVEVSSHFCKKCNVLQKPDLSMNYFDIIRVDTKYEINVNELTRKYRKLQNILHPDRFSNRDKEEIKISEDFSSLVNKAYTTLLNPLLRGQYMLQLKGIFIEDGRVESSHEFLMEMMEKNEEIDKAQDAEQLKVLEAQNKISMEELAKQTGEALNLGDIKCAEEVLIKMKYYASMGAKIKYLKQKKGFGD